MFNDDDKLFDFICIQLLSSNLTATNVELLYLIIYLNGMILFAQSKTNHLFLIQNVSCVI